MGDFLDSLTVTEDERSKLRALGVQTPLGLLSMRKASTRAFDEHFGGPARAQFIAEQLKNLLTDAELQSLNQPIRQGGRLGARLDAPVTPKDPNES